MNEYFEKMHLIIPRHLKKPYLSLSLIASSIAVASGIGYLDNQAKKEYQEVKAQYDKGERTIEPRQEDYNPVRKVVDRIAERIFRLRESSYLMHPPQLQHGVTWIFESAQEPKYAP